MPAKFLLRQFYSSIDDAPVIASFTSGYKPSTNHAFRFKFTAESVAVREQSDGSFHITNLAGDMFLADVTAVTGAGIIRPRDFLDNGSNKKSFDDSSNGHLNVVHHSIESGTAAADKDKNLGRWDNTYNAGNGNDKIRGGDGDDTLNGGYGRDKLYGGRGEDVLNGEADKDYLRGGSGKDILNGGVGYDKLFGGTGNDILNGGTGQDRLRGGDHEDTLNGDGGKDWLHGGDGNDILKGGSSRDKLRGEADDDILVGGNHGDWLIGGAGDDVLYGGHGRDTFTGGAGADTFVINKGDSKFDVVIDFENGTDKIRIYTATGNETTIEALNLKLTTKGTGDIHVVIWDTKGTKRQKDDDRLLVLETETVSNITIDDFEVLATSDSGYAVLDIV